MSDAPAPPGAAGAGMTHRQVLESMSGLLLGMLVAILSSTVVTTALPRIIADLDGTQSSLTWVITSTLLAMTVSTPIWGKLADLFDRKLLVQLGLTMYVLGSVLAGFAESTSWLIGCRVIQGLGVGGLMSLVQVILSDLVSPRERGRYMGYLGAVMAVGTVSGPLIGGVITDSSLGWRWCFFVGVPVGTVALVVLQRTLHLPKRTREVSIDYLGAVLISAGVSALLIWVSLAGKSFAWSSVYTALLVPGGSVLLVLAYLQERRAREPLVPLRLFRNRSIVLAVIASVGVGVSMFGTAVFLSQYLQLARGKSPTESGLLTIPMVIGTLISSIVIGRIITRTGRYKHWMVAGAVLLTLGLIGMGTLDETTNLIELGGFMFLIGLGIGMVMQNLVLVVQNTVDVGDIGAASALVAFFRSLSGAAGVAALGAVLGSRVSTTITEALPNVAIDTHAIPDLATLPPDVRGVVEHAYGLGTGEIFLISAPAAAIALVAIALIKEVPLGGKSGIKLAAEKEAAAGTAVAAEMRVDVDGADPVLRPGAASGRP